MSHGDLRTDPRTTWTIKSMSVHARERAVRAAVDAGMTIGEWMELAISRMLDPPPAETRSEAATAGKGSGRSLIPLGTLEPPTGELVRLAWLIQAAGALAQATNRPSPGM